MRSNPGLEATAEAFLSSAVEKWTDEDLDLRSNFEVAILARAYTIKKQSDEWKLLLLEALDAAAAGTQSVPPAASATY